MGCSCARHDGRNRLPDEAPPSYAQAVAENGQVSSVDRQAWDEFVKIREQYGGRINRALPNSTRHQIVDLVGRLAPSAAFVRRDECAVLRCCAQYEHDPRAEAQSSPVLYLVDLYGLTVADLRAGETRLADGAEPLRAGEDIGPRASPLVPPLSRSALSWVVSPLVPPSPGSVQSWVAPSLEMLRLLLKRLGPALVDQFLCPSQPDTDSLRETLAVYRPPLTWTTDAFAMAAMLGSRSTPPDIYTVDRYSVRARLPVIAEHFQLTPEQMAGEAVVRAVVAAVRPDQVVETVVMLGECYGLSRKNLVEWKLMDNLIENVTCATPLEWYLPLDKGTVAYLMRADNYRLFRDMGRRAMCASIGKIEALGASCLSASMTCHIAWKLLECCVTDVARGVLSNPLSVVSRFDAMFYNLMRYAFDREDLRVSGVYRGYCALGATGRVQEMAKAFPPATSGGPDALALDGLHSACCAGGMPVHKLAPWHIGEYGITREYLPDDFFAGMPEAGACWLRARLGML